MVTANPNEDFEGQMKLGKIEARMLFQLSLPTEGQTDGYGDKGESCLWVCHRAMHCIASSL